MHKCASADAIYQGVINGASTTIIRSSSLMALYWHVLQGGLMVNPLIRLCRLHILLMALGFLSRTMYCPCNFHQMDCSWRLMGRATMVSRCGCMIHSTGRSV